MSDSTLHLSIDAHLEAIAVDLSDPSEMSLDDLFAESMAEAKAVEEVKKARKAVTYTGKDALTAEARNSLQMTIRSWEARREWKPAASVVMFSRQQCQSCGQFHTQFVGFFQRQEHRSLGTADRWIPSVRPQTWDKLPRESKYQDSHTELCEDCAEKLGFEVEES